MNVFQNFKLVKFYEYMYWIYLFARLIQLFKKHKNLDRVKKRPAQYTVYVNSGKNHIVFKCNTTDIDTV